MSPVSFSRFSLFLATACAAIGLSAAPPVSAQTPDTLEVFVLYIEFLDEGSNNEPGTTGRGVFGSDPDLTYTLDPNGTFRRSAAYLEKRFEFARDYFDKVSDGRVVILPPRLFPAADPDGLVNGIPNLRDRMKAYNPALQDKSAKQQTRDFQEQQAIQLMRFVSETIREHDLAGDTTKNPFLVAANEAAANPSSNHHRAFLIFHAGHSRLIDGGTLGYLGANTPNDLIDFFVIKEYFEILSNASDPNLRRDSLGVALSTGDTLSRIMMLSESASQDGVNWGINGILINQLARQMGMPDLFDVVKGISQVGTFDVMDFAGYNTMQGFLPIFPSAWVRTFMGWDEPVVARPGTGAFTDYPIHAADQPGPGRTRTVKIPLNDREYLLVENRQRAAGSDLVTVFFSEPSGPTDWAFSVDTSVTVSYDFLDSLFLDSLCTQHSGSRCTQWEPNDKRPRGIITGASHYDVGLPGNGLLVWHVNDWFIESFLPFGAVNAWLGDTLRNQYKGLELVEADGIPSIGKEFSDALGQPAFDYGTAQDMLPHVFRKRRNPPRDTTWGPPDTITFIGAYGFANTNSWNDGRTHIKLEALLPANPVFSGSISSFTGDSVRTVRDSAITLRVHWPDNNSIARPANSEWPARTAAASGPQAVNLMRDGSGRAHIVSLADTGWLQTYAADGKLALAARDTVRGPGTYDSVEVMLSSGNRRPDNAAPVNSLVDPAGAPLGAAVVSDSILAVLTPQALRLIHTRAQALHPDSLAGGSDTALAMAGKAGPMVWGGRVFALDSAGVLRWWDAQGNNPGSAALPEGSWHALAGLSFGNGNEPHVIVAGRLGRALRVNPATASVTDLNPGWGPQWVHDSTEVFSVTVADFDRIDEHDDVLLLGSRGAALIVYARSDRQGQPFTGWPQRLPRSAAFEDSLGTYFSSDPSPPAITDLNRDRHPDIVFSGTNAIYAMDWRGAILPGWPFRMQPRQLVGFTYANRNLPASVIGSSPLAVSLRGSPAVLTASPDGLIYAVDSAGKRIGYSSFGVETGRGTGVLMANRADWPLAAGGISLDSTRSPFVHISLGRLGAPGSDLDLVAQTAAGNLSVWTLREAADSPANWLMPWGDPGRSARFDASALGTPGSALARESIEEFRLYPSPLRGGIATLHLKLGDEAPRGARIRVFDLSGRMVHQQVIPSLTAGTQPPVHKIDLRHLGPDVYTVHCEVRFAGGTKSKWQRLGVVK